MRRRITIKSYFKAIAAAVLSAVAVLGCFFITAKVSYADSLYRIESTSIISRSAARLSDNSNIVFDTNNILLSQKASESDDSIAGSVLESGSAGIEISYAEFKSDLYNRKIAFYSTDITIEEALKKYTIDVGSSYDELVQQTTRSLNIPSSVTLSVNFLLKDWMTVENVRTMSTADRIPALYLMDGNVFYPAGKCSNVSAIKGVSKTNITIRNCVFENMSGIDLVGCRDVVIENCYFKGAENGIHLASCQNVIIRNCTFDMNSTGLADYYQGVYLADGNQDILVDGCYFKADADIKKPFRIGSTGDAEKASVNVLFRNCISDGYFRDGFQNIDGEALLEHCIFIFREDPRYYGSPVVLDAGSDRLYTTLRNCEFYAEYRKQVSNCSTTVFEKCSYYLLGE